MGSSYVSLNEAIPDDQQETVVGVEYGFWVRDGELVQFLSAMREEIAHTPETPDWLKSLSQKWSSVTEDRHGSGCELVFPHDMRFNDHAKAAVFSIARRVLDKVLTANGDFTVAYPSTKGPNNASLSGTSPGLSERLMFLEIGMRLCDLTCGMIETGERGAGIGRRPEDWFSFSPVR